MSELSKSKIRSFDEYDAFNFLDDLVLNLLIEQEKLSTQEIIKHVQTKIAVTESTIYTCLFLMYLNGLISNQCVGIQNFYKITEEGNQFLIEYDQIKTKILELSYSHRPSKLFMKKESDHFQLNSNKLAY